MVRKQEDFLTNSVARRCQAGNRQFAVDLGTSWILFCVHCSEVFLSVPTPWGFAEKRLRRPGPPCRSAVAIQGDVLWAVRRGIPRYSTVGKDEGHTEDGRRIGCRCEKNFGWLLTMLRHLFCCWGGEPRGLRLSPKKCFGARASPSAGISGGG